MSTFENGNRKRGIHLEKTRFGTGDQGEVKRPKKKDS